MAYTTQRIQPIFYNKYKQAVTFKNCINFKKIYTNSSGKKQQRQPYQIRRFTIKLQILKQSDLTLLQINRDKTSWIKTEDLRTDSVYIRDDTVDEIEKLNNQ